MAKYDNQYDKMTKTPVQQLIVTLAVPTILTMLVTNIYNLVDTAFVGRLGTSASGAVGVVFGFMSILQAVGFMFGQGSGSMVARKLGGKDKETASRIASTGFFSAFSIAVVVAIICFLTLEPLVRVLGSTETIAPYAIDYIKYILISSPFVVTSFTLNNILRYEGKAALGMIGMMTGGVLNIAGDAYFMFKLDMGISGAGLSTALSQIVSFLILISMFVMGKTQTRISLRYVENVSLIIDRLEGRSTALRFARPELFPLIVTTGFPSLVRQALGSIATIILNQKAAYFAADEGVAAMSIVSRVAFFMFAISLGIGQGFQPVSAFNYGASKFARLRKAYKFTMILSEAVLLVLTAAALICSGGIIRIFRDDPTVIQIGTRALRVLCMGQIFLPICMVTEMLMQSTGHNKSALFLSSLRGGLIFIPLLLILPMFRGMYGVEEAQPLAFFLSVFPALILGKNYFKEIPASDMDDSHR